MLHYCHMKPLRISVIVPAYNEEKLLGRCLTSLQNQTTKPYEVIVVDNNSSDSTMRVAKKYRATVVSEKRQGIAWARDAGFNHATGDILARLDADCIAPSAWIQTINDYYQRRPLTLASGIGGMGHYATRWRLIGKVMGFFMSSGYHIGNRIMLGSDCLYGSCMAFPRSWWEPIKNEVCHDSHAAHEDIDLTVHLLKSGKTIQWLPKLYTYIDTRTLREPFKKTLWRWHIWPDSALRHGRAHKSR